MKKNQKVVNVKDKDLTVIARGRYLGKRPVMNNIGGYSFLYKFFREEADTILTDDYTEIQVSEGFLMEEELYNQISKSCST